VTKIEERVIHLKSEIEELRITSEKSHVAHITSLKYSNILDELDLSNPKNLPILIKTSMEGLSAFLEYLRDRIAIIRKISPKTADQLQSQVNFHEERSIRIIDELKKAKTLEQLDKRSQKAEFQKQLSELMINAISVIGTVETCHNFLLDTIEYLEDETPKK